MSENKSKFPSRPKILAVSLAGILIALPAYAADNPPAEVTESGNIEALTVTGMGRGREERWDSLLLQFL